jgi:hypothetical protein
MSTTITWHGTQEEALRLLAAIVHNCDCQIDPAGVRAVLCTSHEMLSKDQRALDGLLFARHMARRLRAEEFSTGSRSHVES